MRVFWVMSIAFLAAFFIDEGQKTGAAMPSGPSKEMLEYMATEGDWLEIGHP